MIFQPDPSVSLSTFRNVDRIQPVNWGNSLNQGLSVWTKFIGGMWGRGGGSTSSGGMITNLASGGRTDSLTLSCTDPWKQAAFDEQPPGSGIYFDGSDYASMPSNAWLQSDYATAMFWVVPESLGTFDYMFNHTATTAFNTPGFAADTNNTAQDVRGIVNTSVSTYVATASGYLGTGLAVHCCVSYDGANLKTYVDGNLRATTAATGTISYQTDVQSLFLGAFNTGNGYFTGHVYDFRLFRRGMGECEVREQYARSRCFSHGLLNTVTHRLYSFPAAAGNDQITGTTTLTFTPSGDVNGTGALAGTSSLTFTPSGDVTNVGTNAITGTSTVTFSPSGSIAGTGALAGTSTVTFTPSGAVTDSGTNAITGTTTLTFAPSAAIAGTGALLGTSTLTFTPTADLAGTGALTSTTTLTFTPSAAIRDAASVVPADGLSYTLEGTPLQYTLEVGIFDYTLED